MLGKGGGGGWRLYHSSKSFVISPYLLLVEELGIRDVKRVVSSRNRPRRGELPSFRLWRLTDALGRRIRGARSLRQGGRVKRVRGGPGCAETPLTGEPRPRQKGDAGGCGAVRYCGAGHGQGVTPPPSPVGPGPGSSPGGG